LPAGVSTAIFTFPGPEITPVVSFTVSFVGLAMTALRGVAPTSTSLAETKLLPVTTRFVPFCTCVNCTVLGDRAPISGAGLALPQSGFKVLLHPTAEKATTAIASKEANHRAQLRKRMRDTPWDGIPRPAGRAVRLIQGRILSPEIAAWLPFVPATVNYSVFVKLTSTPKVFDNLPDAALVANLSHHGASQPALLPATGGLARVSRLFSWQSSSC
jgi:hypothetical protein